MSPRLCHSTHHVRSNLPVFAELLRFHQLLRHSLASLRKENSVEINTGALAAQFGHHGVLGTKRGHVPSSALWSAPSLCLEAVKQEGGHSGVLMRGGGEKPLLGVRVAQVKSFYLLDDLGGHACELAQVHGLAGSLRGWKWGWLYPERGRGDMGSQRESAQRGSGDSPPRWAARTAPPVAR